VTPRQVIAGFPEMQRLAPRCRHAPRCSHIDEAVEECAVLRAVAAGGLPESRYASFATMLLEEREHSKGA